MNEVDRWINGEGPPPEPIRGLLEAAREHRAAPPPTPCQEWTPELEAELTQRVYAAIAVEEAKWARERRIKIAVGVSAVALGMAAALALWLHPGPPVGGPTITHEAAPSVMMLAPAETAATTSTAAPALPRR